MFRFLKKSANLSVYRGPTYGALEFWVLMQNNHRKLYITMHLFAVMFIISQYIELWIIREDLELAMRNLSVTMLSTVCTFKSCIFVFRQNSWTELIKFVSDLETSQLSKKDQVTKKIIDDYTKYARRVSYLYKVLIATTVGLVIFAPLFSFLSSSTEYREMIRNGTVSYPEILSSWAPFDRTRGWGYCLVALEHAVICCYGGSVVANFDCNSITIMLFFTGQLKLLSINCGRMFGNDEKQVDCDEASKRIKECHFHHLYLVKYSSVLNSLLSPVMFLYVIICSLMICASAVQLTTEGTGNMQRIWIAEYLIALIAQLFLYCWHSNDVLYMSDKVDEKVYSSAWYTQNVKIRRSVLLLGGQLRKTIEFTAGPFTKLNLATFVAILKGSYSYYTLLAKQE